MPSGAPARVPSCQSSFFLRDQGFLPQKVQPLGLEEKGVVKVCVASGCSGHNEGIFLSLELGTNV